jgi:hypothetical protein
VLYSISAALFMHQRRIVVVFLIVQLYKGTRKVVTHTISEVAGQAIGNVAGKAISNTVYPPSKPTIQSLENELARTADSINKTLPMTIDKETRLDKVEINSGLRLTFFHTLLNYSSREVDINPQIQANVKNNICSNEERKSYLQHGVTFDYIYRGNDGVYISRIETNINDCNNSSNVVSITPPTATMSTVNEPQSQTVGCIGNCTNGYGTYTFNDGTKITGEWRNGQPTVSDSTTNQPQPTPQVTQQDRAIQKAEAQARKQAKKQARAEALARKQEEIQTQIREQTETFSSPVQTQTWVQPEANSKPLSLRERAEADSRAFSLHQQESDKRQSEETRAWIEAQKR